MSWKVQCVMLMHITQRTVSVLDSFNQSDLLLHRSSSLLRRQLPEVNIGMTEGGYLGSGFEILNSVYIII